MTMLQWTEKKESDRLTFRFSIEKQARRTAIFQAIPTVWCYAIVNQFQFILKRPTTENANWHNECGQAKWNVDSESEWMSEKLRWVSYTYVSWMLHIHTQRAA